MKERDIFIIICILLILSVIKIINNKFIENFENRFDFTEVKSKDIKNRTVNYGQKLQDLETDAEDITKLQEAKTELDESKKYSDILTRRQREEEELFNSSHGKFQKFEKKSCAFLDITTMPCTDDPTDNNPITKCKINCAQNCLLDKNCISFEYNNNTNTCKLSSSCYEGNLNDNINSENSDIYFKENAEVPKLAQFRKVPKKVCPSHTKINNKRFPNTTLSECAQKCLKDDPTCISFEYKQKDGNDNNVCHLTNNCHKYYYTNNNNSDVFMKNNVKINKILHPRNLPLMTHNINYYDKLIHFYWKPKFKHRKWSYAINSKPGSTYNNNWVTSWPNDDWGSIEIPPRTELIIYEHSNYKGSSKIYTNNDYVNYSNIDNLHGWRDEISSFKARSL